MSNGEKKTCESIQTSHIAPGWICCQCRAYNGLQRSWCKFCRRMAPSPPPSSPVHTTPLPAACVAVGVDRSTFSKMERALLTAAAQYSARPLTAAQLASYAGYSRRNGDIPTVLARLRREGFLDGTTITPKGRQSLGPTEPLPTGAALRRHWLQRLDRMEARFFEAICAAGARGLSLDEACAAAGYSRNNGDIPSALAKLRRLDLISQRQPLRANAILFDDHA
jgi:hypothetical protein